MPELPEVETVVRGLRPALVGRTVVGIRVLRPDVLRQTPRGFSDALRTRTFESVSRRGKNIVARMSDDAVLVVNLGMTGRLLVSTSSAEATHPAVRFRLDLGPPLVYDDVRRFGALEALDEEAWKERSRNLGPEPLSPSYTARRLHADLSASVSPVRSWLLDQRRLAGVGNIYANAALHLAGIHPRRAASSVSEAEARTLHRTVRQVLRTAIRNRGTTLRDYRDVAGAMGDNARTLRVYGRDGRPCPRCTERIERLVFGNRSAFYCPRCQPETGGRSA